MIRSACCLAFCLIALAALPAAATPTAAVKARVGWSAIGSVDSLHGHEDQAGIGLATQPVHAALGAFYAVTPRFQVGVMAGYGRFLGEAEEATTEAISVLPTLRVVSGSEGLGAYGEFGLGYSYLNQLGDDDVTSHGWQTQLEGGLTLGVAAGLQVELGVAFAFRMGGNSTAAGPTGAAAFGVDAPDLRLGLSYAL